MWGSTQKRTLNKKFDYLSLCLLLNSLIYKDFGSSIGLCIINCWESQIFDYNNDSQGKIKEVLLV